jgi:hypothetical protein
MGGAECYSPCFQDLDFKQISFNRISAIVEVGAVGGLHSTATSNVFLHVDNVETTKSLTNLVTSVSGNATLAFNGSQGTTHLRLPPSSSMAFLEKKDIPAVFISEYQTAFLNK